jgi:hypothetical protein
MDTANIVAPVPLRVIRRTRTVATPTSFATDGGTHRRLLRALAGPASTAPFYRPQDPRRHHRPPPSAQRPR